MLIKGRKNPPFCKHIHPCLYRTVKRSACLKALVLAYHNNCAYYGGEAAICTVI